MKGADWKNEVFGPPARRESPDVPSASGPKWTTEEVDCMVLAFDACKLNPARFHAEFNDVTEGRQRTLAELRLHLPRVAKARGFEVPQKFLDDCDATIDGTLATAKQVPSEATVITAASSDRAAFCRHIDRSRELIDTWEKRGIDFTVEDTKDGTRLHWTWKNVHGLTSHERLLLHEHHEGIVYVLRARFVFEVHDILRLHLAKKLHLASVPARLRDLINFGYLARREFGSAFNRFPCPVEEESK